MRTWLERNRSTRVSCPSRDDPSTNRQRARAASAPEIHSIRRSKERGPSSVPGNTLRSALHKAFAVLPIVAVAVSLAVAAPARALDTSNVLVIEDDGTILTPPDPVPLAGKRLTFAPVPGGGYATRIGPSRGLLRRGNRVDFATQPEGVVRVALPVPVSFYGQPYDEIYVHPQGVVTFGAPLSAEARADASGQLLAGVLGGPPAVAVLWNELQPSPNDLGRGVFVDQAAGATMVTWYQTPSIRPAGEPNTFRLTLAADGTIDLDYGSLSTRWGIVGLSPGSDRDGVRIADFATTPPIAARTATLAWYHDLPQLNEIALARAVYARLPDRFQFLTAFTTQPVDGPTPVWSTTIRNGDRGIGMPVFDHGGIFGSDTLEHVVVMNDVGFYADDPEKSPLARGYAYAPSTLAVLAHEVGHRWLAYAGASEQGLAGPDGHWTYALDSGASFLGGNEIRANDDGSFSTTAAMRTYGPLDRYLMGFATAAEVPPFFVVDDAHAFEPPPGHSGEAFGPDAHPEAGVRFKGTRRDLSIDDVRARIGVREPGAPNARIGFRMATVLVVPAGGRADTAQVEKVERIRRAFGPFFRAATGHRARMGTWLPAAREPARVPADPLLLAGRPRLLDGSVRRDASGRGEVVLDYADFDGDLTALLVTTDAAGAVPPITVDVAQGTLGNRRGSLSFVLRDLPPDAKQLQLALIDNRGLATRATLALGSDDVNPQLAAR